MLVRWRVRTHAGHRRGGRAFLASCREHRLYAAYHLIALRGLRRGEAIGLRWCDLDLDRGIGYICRQRVRLREQVLETPPKTPNSRRPLVLDRTTVTILRQHRARQNAACTATGSEPSGYVFHRPARTRHRPPRHLQANC